MESALAGKRVKLNKARFGEHREWKDQRTALFQVILRNSLALVFALSIFRSMRCMPVTPTGEGRGGGVPHKDFSRREGPRGHQCASLRQAQEMRKGPAIKLVRKFQGR